jgi:hypothetical protein
MTNKNTNLLALRKQLGGNSATKQTSSSYDENHFLYPPGMHSTKSISSMIAWMQHE